MKKLQKNLAVDQVMEELKDSTKPLYKDTGWDNDSKASTSQLSSAKASKGLINFKPSASSAQKSDMRMTLQQSENLRIAQDRIVALEAEIERLRKENEELIATGDVFRERLDKALLQIENLKQVYEEKREDFHEEKRTLMDTMNSQGQEIDKMRIKNKDLEKRLSNNIQQIRVRERELENRLELMKLDSQTLVREKDQYILDLKRQLDRMKVDLDGQKNKCHEILQKLQDRRNQNRRALRGLHMALHILKGEEQQEEEEKQQPPAENNSEQE